MKYLIISIYDDGYGGFGICDGGDYIEKYYNYYGYGQEDTTMHEICLNYHQLAYKDWQEWLKEKYKNYDLITICADGGVLILVDKTKNTEKD